jgi:hypothetical protein
MFDECLRNIGNPDFKPEKELKEKERAIKMASVGKSSAKLSLGE